MIQVHVIVGQTKNWLDSLPALGAIGSCVSAVAALIAVCVSLSISRRQMDLQERQLRQDLWNRRFKVFTNTGAFIRSVLTGRTAGFNGTASLRFGEMVQRA